MKIGILVLFVNSFGKRGLYNSQEIGIAKELSRRGHNVTIYKCVSATETRNKEILYENVIYNTIPVKTLGNNAITDFHWIDVDLDAIICFSDIQLYTKKAYEWIRQHNIIFIPYVGIAHSTSPSLFKRLFMNYCARSAYATYKKVGVLTKTHAVKKQLESKKITDIKVAPVGLDFDLLHQDYSVPDVLLKKELGLSPDRRYILLVGRIANDRNPLDVVTTFDRIHKEKKDVNLIVIGKGPLKEELKKQLDKRGLGSYTHWVEQVPNEDMWKYYRSAIALVSFSRTEIFGMSILEAMYYELPVFAIHAPGPDDIIVNKISGYLFSSPEEMGIAISKEYDSSIGKQEHQRIVEHFTWRIMADIVEEKLSESVEL